nr:MAG TPA: hypothetical protein [Caudoviricetes sp.]
MLQYNWEILHWIECDFLMILLCLKYVENK